MGANHPQQMGMKRWKKARENTQHQVDSPISKAATWLDTQNEKLIVVLFAAEGTTLCQT